MLLSWYATNSLLPSTASPVSLESPVVMKVRFITARVREYWLTTGALGEWLISSGINAKMVFPRFLILPENSNAIPPSTIKLELITAPVLALYVATWPSLI